MKTQTENKNLLLHACCGPCSLKPFRILKKEGWNITIFYSNSNIYPQTEYDKRLNTLLNWAKTECIPVISDDYQPLEWAEAVAPLGEHNPNTPERIVRCSACYLQRFTRAAKYAAKNNFPCISTTLSVSPYQYTSAIEKKLCQAAEAQGVDYIFKDFTSHYMEATKRSKQLGMYRQHYCGCEFSLRESENQQAEAKKKREQNIAAQQKIHEDAVARHAAHAKKNALKRKYKENFKQLN